MSFLNKVALVTGASSGIGASIAQRFSAEGAKVVIVGRNEKKLQGISEKCEQSGNKPLTIIVDVTNDDSAKKIVSDTLNSFGKLDVLVNNAGIGKTSSILAPDALQVYDQVMATNLRAIVNMTNQAAPHLIQTKGNIVNISSTAGVGVFLATGFAYNASKAALDHFTRTVAAELSRKGVRVNGISPGPVATEIVSNMGVTEEYEAKFWDAMKKSTALNRISDPEEIADLVMYLASDKARGITGSSFVIDNGALVKH